MNDLNPKVTLEMLGTDGPVTRYRTKSLFHEFKFMSPDIVPVYNLSRRDHSGTQSMYNIYMSFETEYEAAIFLLGNWEHWQALCTNTSFSKHLEKWRQERAIKEAAMAHRILIAAAENGNITAAKTILLDSKKVTKAGRPSNQQIQVAAKAQAEMDAFLVHSIGNKR